MEVSVDILVKCGVSRARAEIYSPILTTWSDIFGINTKMRMSHFLAQVLHESMCLVYTREIASGARYEGRKDLGNVVKGDGVRYKGRGLIQITGRANYKAYQDSGYCTGNIMDNPSLLERPLGAVKSAMWWWWRHGLNSLADRDELTRITKIINGGYNGKRQRLMYLGRAKRAYGLLK